MSVLWGVLSNMIWCDNEVNYNDQKRPSGDELADSCKTGGYHSILGDREKIRGTYREIVLFNEDSWIVLCKWGGFWTVWKPKKLIFWTKNSGIRYILHTFATTFAGSEVFCGLELLGTGSQKTFLNSSKDLFLKQVLQACHRRVWARIWPRLYSSPPEIGGRGDEVQRCHPPHIPSGGFFLFHSAEKNLAEWLGKKRFTLLDGDCFLLEKKRLLFFSLREQFEVLGFFHVFFFNFHPSFWGEMILHFDEHIFQLGWFNHQLEKPCWKCLLFSPGFFVEPTVVEFSQEIYGPIFGNKGGGWTGPFEIL